MKIYIHPSSENDRDPSHFLLFVFCCCSSTVLAVVQAKAIPIPGILGVVVGLAVGWFIFRIGKEASLKKLLIASTIVLLFIAGKPRHTQTDRPLIHSRFLFTLMHTLLWSVT